MVKSCAKTNKKKQKKNTNKVNTKRVEYTPLAEFLSQQPEELQTWFKHQNDQLLFSNLMGPTPVIKISIRMIRKLRNILQVKGCSWWLLCIIDPMCHIFFLIFSWIATISTLLSLALLLLCKQICQLIVYYYALLLCYVTSHASHHALLTHFRNYWIYAFF